MVEIAIIDWSKLLGQAFEAVQAFEKRNVGSRAEVNESERAYNIALHSHDKQAAYDACVILVAMRKWRVSELEGLNADLKRYDDQNCGCYSCSDPNYYHDVEQARKNMFDGISEEHKHWLQYGPPWSGHAVDAERITSRGTPPEHTGASHHMSSLANKTTDRAKEMLKLAGIYEPISGG